jgi:hypothetical protein
LQIIGCGLSDRLAATLSDYGFTPEAVDSHTVRAIRTKDI